MVLIWFIDIILKILVHPEIKLLKNEEIIFSNYKIVAFDEGHTIWNQNLRFITALY